MLRHWGSSKPETHTNRCVHASIQKIILFFRCYCCSCAVFAISSRLLNSIFEMSMLNQKFPNRPSGVQCSMFIRLFHHHFVLFCSFIQKIIFHSDISFPFYFYFWFLSREIHINWIVISSNLKMLENAAPKWSSHEALWPCAVAQQAANRYEKKRNLVN